MYIYRERDIEREREYYKERESGSARRPLFVGALSRTNSNGDL